MDFSKFVSGYQAGTVRAHVDGSRAVRVCNDSPALPRRYRTAHLIGKNVIFFLVLGGLISLFWVPWWAGLGAVVLGFLIAPAVQKSAAQFVLRYSLEDETFFRQMQDAGVLKVEQGVFFREPEDKNQALEIRAKAQGSNKTIERR